jgi:hypothetical protein
VVGIDPDLKKSGVAVVSEGKLITLDCLKLLDLIEFISEHKHRAHFVIENVNHDKTTYKRVCANVKAMGRISQNVGMVKAVGTLLEEILTDLGAEFTSMKPLRGAVKKAKNDRNYFNKITGWTDISNQDKRDAALLAMSYTGTLGC